MTGSPQSSGNPSYDPQVLLNSQPVIVTVIDPADHSVQFQNRTSLGAFGDIAGSGCHEKIMGKTAPCEFCRMPEALIREGVVSDEVEMPDGRHLLIHWAKAPTADGRVHVIETIVDVTKRKQDEQSLRQSQKMEALGRLAAGIAHDFNNLLMVVIGHAQRVAQQLGTHPCHHEVEMIGQAGTRAAALTKKLLTFSRRQVLEQRDVPLNTLIREMEDILRRLIGEQIQTVIVLNPQAGHVLGDSVQIEQVLLNLALNARDAMAEGGILTIETGNADLDEAYVQAHPGAIPGPYVTLVVEDTGCGIDAETLAHIFEPFFSTKDVGKGTGLGLATVYGIVKESRGYIDVRSQPGRGSRFTVMLPRVLMQEREAEPVSESRAVPTACATILLVEDDEGIRRLVAAVLRDQGYEVLAAADGVEALQMLQLRKGGCDLLITDVILPRMKAAVLAQGAKTMFPHIKVLYISGYAGDMLVSHGVDAQAAYLQKPFLPQAIIDKVAELLLPARLQ
ncbi:MAG: ATP-binding protein [Nitrospira sp.]|nr:ATP-binding protein [Nitrospira sp.]